MNEQSNKSNNTADNEIAIQAYYFWEADGRPEGREMEHWAKAKSQLEKGGRNSSSAQANQSSRGDSPARINEPSPDTAQNGEKQPRDKKKNQNRQPGQKQAAYA